jgi:DNA-binding Lrp family transcriptional regulator
MNIESQRDLQLLEAVEEQSQITQRTLAARLGIALGLTNLYLRRLARKGYIKCVTISPNRLGYLITPRGVARKARLTFEFMKYSLDLYRDARRHVRQSLNGQVGQQKLVAIFGTGEAAELAFLLMREIGLEPVAVFDGQSGGHFLGLPVRSIEEQGLVQYDVLIVAVLEKIKRTSNRLIAVGVPREKLLLLRNLPAARPQGHTVKGEAANKAR